MGVLTDLIMANEDELLSLPKDKSPIQVFPGIDIRGFDVVQFGILYSIVKSQEFDSSLSAFPLINDEGPEQETWISGLPEDLIEALISMNENELSRVNSVLYEKAEGKKLRWVEADILKMLNEIRSFLIRAQKEKKPVYIWSSL